MSLLRRKDSELCNFRKRVLAALSMTVHSLNLFFGAAGIKDTKHENPPKVNMAALETDNSITDKLAAIGLEPMAVWMQEGCPHKKVPGHIVCACAMFGAG